MSSSVIDAPSDRSISRRKKGELVWPFRVQSVLGNGAMGDVYLAEHVTDGHLVALKFMPEQLRRNTILVARFRREMQVLQKLRHPSIVRSLSNLSDEQTRKEDPWYAMEYLDGGTFSDLLRVRVRLSATETLRYAIQILGALSAAHKHGVVHRDVKPSNLLISRDRKVLKLCDFGLAMVLGGTQLTEPGQTIGTPWYMSPEQIRGETRLSAASDLYSVGCILMEALTGKPPFTADTHFAILNRHLSEEPPLVSSRVPNLEHASFLDRLVRRLLEKDPASRPQSAGNVIAEIGSVLKSDNSHPVSESPAPRTKKITKKLRPSDRLRKTPKETTVKLTLARLFDCWQRIRQQKLKILGCLLAVSLIANMAWFLRSESTAQLTSEDTAWISQLASQPAQVQLEAVPVLAVIATSEPMAIQTLNSLLDAPEPLVRQRTLRAFGFLGEHAYSSREKIRSVRSDADLSVREEANRTIQIIDGHLPTLPMSALTVDDSSSRINFLRRQNLSGSASSTTDP